MKEYEGLYNIIQKYDNWFNDVGEDKNQEARKALIKFYNALKEKPTAKTYKIGFNSHLAYIRNLCIIRRALKEEKYMRACNEIITLMYREPIYQKRIYYNLLELLQEYLEI